MTAAARRDPTRKQADILGGSLCGTSTSGLIILRHRAVASINIPVVNWGRLLTSSSRSLQQQGSSLHCQDRNNKNCSFYRCFKAKIKAMSRDTCTSYMIMIYSTTAPFHRQYHYKRCYQHSTVQFCTEQSVFYSQVKTNRKKPKNSPVPLSFTLLFFYSIFLLIIFAMHAWE